MKLFVHMLRSTSFNRQLAVAVSFGVVFLAALTSLATSWQSSRQIKQLLQTQGEHVAATLARQSALALLYDSRDNANDAVEATLAFTDVTEVEIRHADGRPLVVRRKNPGGRAERPPTPFPPDLVSARLESEDSDFWRFLAPVVTGTQPDSPFELENHPPQILGYVRIVQSKATLVSATFGVFGVNLGISLLFATMFLIGSQSLTRRLTQPLNKLSATMARAEQGELHVRADLHGPKDIGDMAHAFNSMMAVLEEREMELRKARDEALRYAELKAEFAATVSHELRTPLNGVIGTLDMLLATELPPRQRQFVNLAWDSAQYLLDLINHILDFSKLEAGKLELDHADFDPSALVEDTIELVASTAYQKGLEIGYLIAPDVPPRLLGDARRLRQVLVNLIGNAIKFTDRGEVSIRVSRVSDRPDDNRLRFAVVDTGIGIPPEAQQRIFDSFTQADGTTTRRHGGSGLGLAICRQLIALMGGEIGVVSSDGNGSEFWFEVPLPQVSGESASRRPPPAVPGGRVLVLDTSPVVRAFLTQALTSWGIDTIATDQVEHAVAELKAASGRKESIRAVMIDAVFATTSGGNLLAQLSDDPELTATRIIAMTRLGAERFSPTTKADALLTKPLRLEGVREALASLSEAPTWAKPRVTHAPVRNGGKVASIAIPETHARKVLAVEDNRTSQAVALSMLQLLGCEATVVGSGHEALQAFKREHWDLILMDCNMPDMDGFQVTASIRALAGSQPPRVPIVAMTANSQAADVEKCLAAGMDDHVAKPLTLASLADRLQRWLPVKVPATPVDTLLADVSDAQPNEPLDRAALARLREALGDSISEAVEIFLEDMPTYLEDLEQAATVGDADRLRKTAHAVKGASGNVGAWALAAVAKDIEDRATHYDITDANVDVTRLSAEFALVREALRAEMASGKQTAAHAVSDEVQVLVVDDDRSTRSALRFALLRGGYTVEEAENGLQALDLLGRMSPDIVLMDAMMPVMDGFTACERMQEIPGCKDIPVLMITGLDDSQSIERAFAAGARDYITKPIHLAVVNQRVHRIVEANRAERHIRQLAYNDTLTGLPNRTLFSDFLRRSLARASELGQSLAVLFLDLDRFKFVNDSLGHEVGDRLLQSVAMRIKQTVRAGDCVARLGGDEFVLVLAELPSPASAANAVQKISRALSAPFDIDGHDIFVSASIGISVYPDDGVDVSTLLRHADTAMYRAKRDNSGFAFYEAAMEASMSEHLRLESALRRALERDELVAFYQPKVETVSGRLVGVEALVRWRHPNRGLISPAEFIPLAEETGVIVPLGEWMLRTVCKQAVAWAEAGWPDFKVAVNISSVQLAHGHIVDAVNTVLSETGLDPKRLILEITESVLMEHARDTITILDRLKAIGVQIAIDDFGTGYSSLSYLKRFPVDTLKIDRSFTRDVTIDPDDAAIVTGIVALAHSLRLKVTAEGVETAEQRAFLAGVECDFIQGFYLSEPAPAEAFERDFLRAGRAFPPLELKPERADAEKPEQ